LGGLQPVRSFLGCCEAVGRWGIPTGNRTGKLQPFDFRFSRGGYSERRNKKHKRLEASYRWTVQELHLFWQWDKEKMRERLEHNLQCSCFRLSRSFSVEQIRVEQKVVDSRAFLGSRNCR